MLNFARIALSSSLSGVTGDTVCPILRSDLFRKDGRDFGITGRNDEATVAKMRKKKRNKQHKQDHVFVTILLVTHLTSNRTSTF